MFAPTIMAAVLQWLLTMAVWWNAEAFENLDRNQFNIPSLSLDDLLLTLSSKLLLDIYSPRNRVLKGYLGWLPKESRMNYTSCESDAGSICIRYGDRMKLEVTQSNEDRCEKEDLACHSTSCHKIKWSNHIGGAMDCFILGDEDWYGGGTMMNQRWPLQSSSKPWYPAVTGDPAHGPSGSVVENLWVTSSGFSVFVDRNSPLFVSFNESGSGKLCFTTSSQKHPYIHNKNDKELSYYICSAMDVKEAFEYSVHRWIDTATSIPNEEVLKYPIWSTWARYKAGIDQNKVIQFGQEVSESNFPASQLEIDDKWEDCYGNTVFDRAKFPDPAEMMKELGHKGFPVTLWVHPFCNKECDCYKVGEENRFWVRDSNGNISEVEWWNGIGAVLDTTNADAVQWFSNKLKCLQSSFGITSFKFDAGELMWMQQNFEFDDKSANEQPNIYSKNFADLAAEFGDRVEVRIGWDSQRHPVFVRMYDKDSNWGYPNGLQTLIPSALQLSMMGYYFILPDMIGGNNYNSSSLPDKELFIRWLEANVFLPSMQFSIVPMDYDQEVEDITRNMLEIRSKHSSTILSEARKAAITGLPMIRPIWYNSPLDAVSLAINSEFLLGDEILVAPVLVKGRRSRNIYLPDGGWMDIQRGETYEGPIWIFDYEAPLNFLPYFIKL